MEVLILLTLIGILWLVSSRRWRRLLIKPLAISVIVFLIITSSPMVGLATWGLTASLPTDTGEPTDAIVVLGRGDELSHRRVELAYKLWLAKRAPEVFASGMTDAKYILERLQKMGIPKPKLNGETCSQNTEENALYTSAVLYPQGVRKVILLTDPHHMLRSLLLFRSVGFTVFPHLSPLPSQWNSSQQLLVLAREYFGLALYWVQGEFRQRSVDELEHASAEVTQKFFKWNCKV